MTLTSAPKTGHQTFLYSELATDLDALQADIAFLGIPYGDAYTFAEIVNDQTNMPAAMRRATDRITRSIERYDFDVGGPLYDNQPIRTVDCGDVIGDPRDLTGHYKKAEAAIRKIRAAGALPIVIGGDHGIPIPVLRGLDGDGPITLIQIDQHLDWRNEVNGVTEGYSSPIRRASEMKHVDEIFQIGLRATGSARTEEVEAAKAYGAHLISAYEVHDNGMESVLARIPDGGRYYLTVDLDGMDPAIAPGVAAAPRTPGHEEPGTAEQGYLHCGPNGAGHFVKMVHNGIEYALMASYAEGFNILAHANAGASSRPADAGTRSRSTASRTCSGASRASSSTCVPTPAAPSCANSLPRRRSWSRASGRACWRTWVSPRPSCTSSTPSW